MIPGEIDDSLLADARVAAGDDNRLAVHSDVGVTHTSTKIPINSMIFASGVDFRSPRSYHDTTYLRRPMAVARPTAAVAPIRVQFSIVVTVSLMLSRAKLAKIFPYLIYLFCFVYNNNFHLT